jgi:hypothetical protein
MDTERYFNQITSLTPTDWGKFKIRFIQSHPDFFISLSQRFPTLTRSEVRLAALLEMQFTTEMMANILGICPASIIKSRYRLRKKLNLKRNQKLDIILKQEPAPAELSNA